MDYEFGYRREEGGGPEREGKMILGAHREAAEKG
jgi:hypothetical protein